MVWVLREYYTLRIWSVLECYAQCKSFWMRGEDVNIPSTLQSKCFSRKIVWTAENNHSRQTVKKKSHLYKEYFYFIKSFLAPLLLILYFLSEKKTNFIHAALVFSAYSFSPPLPSKEVTSLNSVRSTFKGSCVFRLFTLLWMCRVGKWAQWGWTRCLQDQKRKRFEIKKKKPKGAAGELEATSIHSF